MDAKRTALISILVFLKERMRIPVTAIVERTTLQVIIECLEFAFSLQGQDYMEGQQIVDFETVLTIQQKTVSITKNVLCY